MSEFHYERIPSMVKYGSKGIENEAIDYQFDSGRVKEVLEDNKSVDEEERISVNMVGNLVNVGGDNRKWRMWL